MPRYPTKSGADLGGDYSPPWCGSLFHVIIMHVTCYFDVVLCPSSSQIVATLKFHSPLSPDPLNARLLRSLGFPKSPPLKNPRPANENGDRIVTINSVTSLHPIYNYGHDDSSLGIESQRRRRRERPGAGV